MVLGHDSQLVLGGEAPPCARYLAGVAHAHVTSLSYSPLGTKTSEIGGLRAPLPGSETLWVVSVQGRRLQALTGPSEHGRWAAVVMNADARPGVAVDLVVGLKTGALLPLGWGASGLGLLVLGGPVFLLLFGLARPCTSTDGSTLG